MTRVQNEDQAEAHDLVADVDQEGQGTEIPQEAFEGRVLLVFEVAVWELNKEMGGGEVTLPPRLARANGLFIAKDGHSGV